MKNTLFWCSFYSHAKLKKKTFHITENKHQVKSERALHLINIFFLIKQLLKIKISLKYFFNKYIMLILTSREIK